MPVNSLAMLEIWRTRSHLLANESSDWLQAYSSDFVWVISGKGGFITRPTRPTHFARYIGSFWNGLKCRPKLLGVWLHQFLAATRNTLCVSFWSIGTHGACALKILKKWVQKIAAVPPLYSPYSLMSCRNDVDLEIYPIGLGDRFRCLTSRCFFSLHQMSDLVMKPWWWASLLTALVGIWREQFPRKDRSNFAIPDQCRRWSIRWNSCLCSRYCLDEDWMCLISYKPSQLALL